MYICTHKVYTNRHKKGSSGVTEENTLKVQFIYNFGLIRKNLTRHYNS